MRPLPEARSERKGIMGDVADPREEQSSGSATQLQPFFGESDRGAPLKRLMPLMSVAMRQ